LSCGDPEDDAVHSLDADDGLIDSELEATVGEDVTPETIITIMINSREKWEAVERYVKKILITKEEEELQRHTNRP
jgi:hypothetical protein